MVLLLGFLRSIFISRELLALENLALRQQLAAYKRTCKRPRLRTFDRAFIKNHGHELFACDFMTQYTALFTTVYVFVVMEISTRRIVLCNVTESPTLDWVKIQIRNSAAFDRKPRFLLHDNDGVFGQFGRRRDGFRCHLDHWLSVTMDIEGLPTPYRAPNANPHVERFHRTLREDALNHFIFLNASHVRRVARDFIEYYNRARPSQATHAIPDPYPELLERPAAGGKLIALPVLGGVQHDYRLAA
jgi:putative transposase